MKNGDVCSSETTTGGGVNVFSCAQSEVSSVDHLVVMVNGILGRLDIYVVYDVDFELNAF